jgi:hypothetical protein
MARIKGTTVKLYEEKVIGYDSLNAPIYEETPVEVDNVLVGEPSTDDITSSTSLYGKKISFMMAIPKGDTHDWVNKKVEWTDAYGITHKCMTFGYPITGIESNIPSQPPWHMKVRCESYEQSIDQTESPGDQSGDEIGGDSVSS